MASEILGTHGINGYPGAMNRDINVSAGIRPSKLNFNYASVAEFLADKAASSNNSSSAENGDMFFHTGLGALLLYDGVSSEWYTDSRNAKHNHVDFTRCNMVMGNLATTGGVSAGTDAALNQYLFNGVPFRFYNEETATIYDPVLTVNGLELSQDQTSGEGREVYNTIEAFGKHAYKIGTDPAFRFKLKLLMPTVTDYSVIYFGFRKAEAAADVDDAAACLTAYTDVAAFNVDDGDITVCTRLNTGTGTMLDSTQNASSATAYTFEVLVSSTGVTTFKHAGSALTQTLAHTFDTGDYVIPFLHCTRDATAGASDELIIQQWTVGLQ